MKKQSETEDFKCWQIQQQFKFESADKNELQAFWWKQKKFVSK